VDFGAHLPLVDFGAGWSLPALKSYARAAATLGYSHLCANDHVLFPRPWLDGPTALAAVIDESQPSTLATTVSLPVLRGPAQLAKTLAALDRLSDGRLLVGVGPGSSAADYAVVGVPFEQRWQRFDEAIPLLRRLLCGRSGGPAGSFYALPDVVLEPHSVQSDGPPIWIASWGSPAGLRRVATHGDGWLASAYNTSPDRFADCLAKLRQLRDGKPLPHALATTWMYVTDDPAVVERMLADVLAPLLNRSVESLQWLPIGPAELCAQRLTAFAKAGAERVFLWPLQDEIEQLEVFQDRVIPIIES
jgi:alkanesulfonate monooxygenase SsuD/methylene tetrahydromethanopterin reductase-like flavin-dependent oxidoreductase (luciferase family)